jgi:P-type E1-E2 ATPase
MTGDGVNDAPPLPRKQADIVSGWGSGTSRDASDLTCIDDTATIVRAIREGRRHLPMFKNSVRYLLSSNAGEVIAW